MTRPTGPTSHEDARERLGAVRAEVAKAVVGQDAAVSGLLVALLCGGHVLMEGVPGVAKTLLVRSLAAALSVQTRRVQFTPDLMPGDITGSMVIDSSRGELTFREGPVFTNLLLADEINRTPPKTQSALLEAMEEGQVTRRRRLARRCPAVPGRRDPEPGRVRRHLSAARGPARPLPAQGRAAGARPRARSWRSSRRHASGFDPQDVAASGVTAVAGADDIEAGRARACARCRSPPRSPGTSSTSPARPGSRRPSASAPARAARSP